ncbi:MAG: T9SS type A sorting domain-containing protein [Bacteroidota bacterium]
MNHIHFKRILFFTVMLFSFSQSVKGQYLETFSTPNKGYLPNHANDFSGLNWTLTSWPGIPGDVNALRDEVDYFSTTAAGKLECVDLDLEVSWESPVMNIGAAGPVTLSVDLTWNGFDQDVAANSCLGDYIRVSYSINGGAFTMIPNQFGGNACGTVAYPFGMVPPTPVSGTVTQGGISGNTLKIRVSVFTNANAELVQIDNVSVPQAGVSLGCVPPTLSTAVTNITCNGPNSGAINLTVTGGVSPYTYNWTDLSGSPEPQDRTGLAAGTYTVNVTDATNCVASTSATVLTAPIVLGTIVSNTSCSTTQTGTIDLSASGGTPGYTYNWADLAGTNDPQDRTGLGAGSYSVTVTDAAGCTGNTNASIAVAPSGAYLETFSIAERGYLVNFVDNFLSVNWSMGPWPLQPPATFGRDNDDYFKTTAAGKLEALDTDNPVYWQSPELNITGLPSVQFSVDLTWLGFDADAAVAGDGDYIAVQYSINGGAYVEIPNAYGGGLHTVNYPIGSGIDRPLLTGSVSKTGLTGNTLQIRIIVNANSNNEVVTIDNVSVPQTISYCTAPIVSRIITDVLCNGAATGAIDITVSGAVPPYTYDWSDVAGTTNPADRTGLTAGNYTVTVSDATVPAHTTTVSYTITQPATALTATTSQTPTACSGGATGSATVNPSGGTPGYTYAWSPSGGTSATATGLQQGMFTCTIKDANQCQIVKSFTIVQPPVQLASSNTNNPSFAVSPSNTVVYDASCNLIATLVPVGTVNALGGNVNAKVTFDGSVQSFGGQPYVQRHYDIEPVTNAANATATVTLYFTQAEFTSYNLARGLYPALPTGSGDAAGIGNLKVNQFHGTGTAPANYTGTSVLIDPPNANIVFNGAASRWEITFSVVGFSGFYITTGTTPLPLTLLDFTGTVQNKKALLKWTTSNEVNTAYIELERSTDARNYTLIHSTVTANTTGVHQYQFTDDLAGLYGQVPFVWYRLKMADKDGRVSYSPVVSIGLKNSKPLITVSPNPFKEALLVQVVSPEQELATLSVTDVSGKIIMQQKALLKQGQNSIALQHLQGFAKGQYLLQVQTGKTKQTVKLVKVY